MLASHPVIHPLEVEGAADPPPGVRMTDLPGMPGTPGDLGLRVTQILLAAISFAVLSNTIMSTTIFNLINAFWVLLAKAIVQSIWTLLVVATDIYVLLVKRSLRRRRFLAVLAIGDGITWVITFIGACGAAGITYMIRQDMDACSYYPCGSLEFAVAAAFISWFSLSMSFILNLYLFASARV